jgi:hypothetical protein
VVLFAGLLASLNWVEEVAFKNILRISVLTLVIRFISLLLMLGSAPALAPNDASGTLFDQPTT